MALRAQLSRYRGFRWSIFAMCCLAPAAAAAQARTSSLSLDAWYITAGVLGLSALYLVAKWIWLKQPDRPAWITWGLFAAGWLAYPYLAMLYPCAMGWHVLRVFALAVIAALFLLIKAGRQRWQAQCMFMLRYYFPLAAGALLSLWFTSITLVSLVEQLMIGLILGSLYALIALGYTLVYGVIKLINFAHGDIYMLGAFIGFYSLRAAIRLLYYGSGVSLIWCWLIALVISAVLCAAIAVIMERLAYRPLRRSSRIAALITAVGVSFLLENAGIIIFKANPKSYEPKTFEVYQVQVAQAVDFAQARQYEVYDTQQMKFPARQFAEAQYARVRVLSPQGESAWTPALTVVSTSPTGMVEIPSGNASDDKVPPPAILSYSVDRQGGKELLVLKWSPAERQAIALMPVFAGADGKALAFALPLRRPDGSELKVPVFNVVIVGVTLLLLWLLNLLISRSMFGISMRALSFDAAAAKLMGVNTDRVISITFAIGGACAAVAGNMVGIYNTLIDPLMGILPGLKAFVAAVVGGIGSIPGAAAGGLIMGVSEALVKGYIPAAYSGVADALAFAILILVLLFKPTGLFGSTVREKV